MTPRRAAMEALRALETCSSCKAPKAAHPHARCDVRAFYKGYVITWNPKPIPASMGCDYDYVHEDYDGAPIYSDGPPCDDRAGWGASVEACKQAIDEREEYERERDNAPCLCGDDDPAHTCVAKGKA